MRLEAKIIEERNVEEERLQFEHFEKLNRLRRENNLVNEMKFVDEE